MNTLTKPLSRSIFHPATATRSRIGIEVLETRIAPAGLLNFSGVGTVTVDLAARTIMDSSAPGSSLDFTGADVIAIGGGASLIFKGTPAADTLGFTPTGASAGTVTTGDTGPVIQFLGIVGAFTVDPLGGSDVITVLGSAGNNGIVAIGGGTETVQVDGTKAITLASGNIESLVIDALSGDDSLTVDSELGAFSVPIAYHGGVGFDTLATQGGTATWNLYQLGATPDAGARTLIIGGVTESIVFTGLEPVLDTVAGALTVNGTNAANSITYRQGGVVANGLIAVDGSETIEFSNKTSLTINALGGDDVISLANPNTPTSLATIVVNGGDPSGSDTLIINGTSGNNTFNYSPSTTVGSGQVSITGAPSVSFTAVEQLSIDGQGGTDSLTVTSSSGRRVNYTPGTAPDSGVIEFAAFGAGTGLVPLSFAHIGALGSITFAGSGDILQVNGTSNSDTFNVTGTTVQLINSTAGFASVLLNVSNFVNVELRGLDGNDVFNLTGTLAAVSGGFIVDGGNPSTSDVVNLSGTTGAVNVTFGAKPTVTGYGSLVTLIGVELVNAAAGNNNATVTGTAGVDVLDITPTGPDAVAVFLASSSPAITTTPVVNISGVGSTMTIDGAGSQNSLVFHGTAGGDSFTLSRNPAERSLALAGTQTITTTNSFFAWYVEGGAGTDSFAINEPTVVQQVEINIDGGAGNNFLDITTAFNQLYVAGAGLSGSFDGGALVNFTNIATADVSLSSPATGATIQANGASNHISVNGIGSSSVQAQVDGGTRVGFDGLLSTLTVQAGGGDNTILVSPGSFVGAGGIVVNSGSPSSNSRLVISGTSAANTFTFAGTSAVAGTVALAGSATTTYSNTKSVILEGLEGVDTFLLASPRGNLEILGGDDADNVSFTGAAAGVVIDLDLLNTPQRVNASGLTIRLADAIENFTGTNLNDTLRVAAGSFPRTLNGGGGTDTLIFSGTGAVVNILPTVGNTGTIQTVGYANAAYDEFEIRNIVNSPSGPAGFGTPATSEAFSAAHIYDPTLFTDGTKLVPGKGPTAVATGDLNGDGFVDMVMVNSKTANLSILLNIGDGTFLDPVNIAAGTAGPQDLVLGDLDGDAILDAVVTFPKAGKLAFFKGDGLGGFGAPSVTLTPKLKPYAIAAADLDGDLDLDLAVTSKDTHSIVVVRGNGAGSLTVGTPIKSAGLQPVDIVIADFNGDAIPDLATANMGSNNINLFRGDGLGGVANPARFAAGIRPTGLAAGDLDNDGDMDLAVSNAISRVVSVFRGAGNVVPASQFANQLRVALPGQHQASAIAIGDFDGDGVADLGIGNGLGTKFTVLRGLGGAIYSQPYDFDLGKDTKPNITGAIALADLNNDGLLDVIATSVASNDLRTLLRRI